MPDTYNPLSFYLCHQGSLTRQLERLAGQDLVVQVVFEGYDLLSLQERQYFWQQGITQSQNPQMAWVRKGYLFGNLNGQTPQPKHAWVYAKTILLPSQLKGDACRLRYLKNTPIGYVLFKKNNALIRHRAWSASGDLPSNELDNKAPATQFITDTRQTLYEWHGCPIYIKEQFLRSFLDKIEVKTPLVFNDWRC